MAERRFYWLKMPNTFFTSKPIKKLRSIAGGDTYTVIYLKMLLASLENDGKLYLEGFEDSAAKEIALEIDENPEDVSITLQFLTKAKLAEIRKEDVALELGNMVGSEASSTIRSRRSRDRAKALQCNTDATICNGEKELEKSKRRVREDLDKEEDKDTELEEKVYYFDNYLNSLFIDYLSFRSKNGLTVNEAVVQSLIERLDDLGANDTDYKCNVLQQATAREWKWLYPVDEKG